MLTIVQVTSEERGRLAITTIRHRGPPLDLRITSAHDRFIKRIIDRKINRRCLTGRIVAIHPRRAKHVDAKCF